MVGLLWVIFILAVIGFVFGVINVAMGVRGDKWPAMTTVVSSSIFALATIGIFSDVRFSPLGQTDLKVGVVYEVLYSDYDLSEDGKKYGGALVLLRWPSVNGGDRRALFELSRVPPPRFFLSEDGEFISLSSPKE